MQRYVFKIQYHGGNYVGWQKQPNGMSVQEKIETAINKLYNSTSISIVGCGRTDAGVHASEYFFHVDLSDKFNLEKLIFKLNKIFPNDISILNAYTVRADFHARFDARERVYKYLIHENKDSFISDLSLNLQKKLNLDKMNEACNYLIGKQDFTSFSKLHTDVKTNICTVNYAKWKINSQNEIYFEISADRFLRNMVRAIVGSLIEVGLGKVEPSEIKSILLKKDRQAAKMSVPAHGLYLSKISYPNDEFI